MPIQAQSIPWLRFVGDETREAALKLMVLQRLRAGAVWRHQGADASHENAVVWGIIQGSARLELVLSDDEDSGVGIAYLGPGGWFGFIDYFSQKPSIYTVQVLEPTAIASLSRESMKYLTERHPDIWFAFARVMAWNTAGLLQRTAAIRTKDKKRRVLLTLESLAPRDWHDGSRMHGAIRVNQETLALLTGMTSRSLRDVLRELKDEGLISTSYAGITLLYDRSIRDIRC